MSNSMKLAWASPFSSASDISAFTRNLLPHLRLAHAGIEYEAFLLVNDNGNRYPTELPAVTLNGGKDIANIASAFDYCIVNIGNNQENHRHIFSFLRQTPSVVIFHDYVYQHVIAWECFENRKSRELYGYLMCELYGDEALKTLESSHICSHEQSSRINFPWDSSASTVFPMAPLFTRLASAVIVHSGFSERLVRSFFDGPILRLQLPADQKRSLTDAEIGQWREMTRTRHIVNAVSFGHVSRHKCLHLTIEAMAESAILRERVQFTIAGHPGDKRYVEELQQLTQLHGLSNNVRFEFSVTDDRLMQIKRDADFFVNVRFPNTEGASGSLTEQMNTGKPVVVANTGCYGEMPEGAVLKINDHSSAGELRLALEKIVQDPTARIKIGTAGMSEIRRVDGASYVRHLKDFLRDNDASLKRRSRQTFVRFTVPKPTLTSADNPDKDWLRSLVATRAALMGLDHDPHVWSPQPFMEWPVARASRFAASILLDEYQNDQLVQEISDQLQADQIAFYERFTELRTLHEFAKRREPVSSIDIIRLRPNLSALFWRLATLLRPSVFVRICFLALYTRPWSVKEAANWELQLERGSFPSDVISEFLRGSEFVELGVQSEDVEWLLKWAEQEVHVNSTSGLPPYRLGTLINFDATNLHNQAYLKGRWYKPETGGTWSEGNHGNVLIPLSNLVPTDLDVELRLRTAGTAVTGPNEVRICIEGHVAQKSTLSNDELTTVHVRIPKELFLADSLLRLVFQVGMEVVPKELGISDDGRILGILLKSIVLKPYSRTD